MIKEFLPNEIAVRQNDATVMPKSATDADNFVWGMDKFLQEAKILAKFKHHNIVQVARFFKQNQTAYFVMDYEEGEDLDQYCKPLTRALAQEEILAIIIPVLDGLKEVHEQDFLHRDIKPGNIFIRKNGSPMLIDFGAAALPSVPNFDPLLRYSLQAMPRLNNTAPISVNRGLILIFMPLVRCSILWLPAMLR